MKRLAFALLLLPSLALADGIAYRVGKGVQITPTATAPTKGSGNGLLWIDSSGSALKYKNAAGVTVTLSGGAGTYNQTIEDEGVGLTQRTNLNFVGAGISCADSGGKTVCTVSSGGSTGNWAFAGDAADDSGAAVLTIGATTATGVTLSRTAGTITLAGDTTVSANKGITAAAGTGAFNFGAGTGVFTTSTGTNTISGAMVFAANKGVTVTAGTSAFDFSGGTGVFTTSTGANTLSGDVTISGAKTFTTGTGTATINGDLQMASGKHIYGGASTSAADFSAGSGVFKTTTGAASYLGSSNTFTTKIVPLTDAAVNIGTSGTGRWQHLYLSGIANSGSVETGTITLGVTRPPTISPAIPSAGPYTLTIPDTAGNDTFAFAAMTQTLTNKTITSPTFSGTAIGTWNIGGTPTATSPILANLGATTVAPSWTNVTYTNSWVDYGASTVTRYTKDATAKVKVEVRAKNGSSASAAVFTLPVGFRPSQNLQVIGYTVAPALAVADVIASTGVFNFSAGGSTSGTFATFEFYAEQ